LTLGLVLVRLGEYGIGVFRGEKLLSSKVGTAGMDVIGREVIVQQVQAAPWLRWRSFAGFEHAGNS
jgi:hypothetical protein